MTFTTLSTTWDKFNPTSLWLAWPMTAGPPMMKRLLHVFVEPCNFLSFVGSFICNCSDCHKLTASIHASNFTVLDTHLKHLRGQEYLKTFAQSKTIFFKEPGKENTMTNYFCSTCGSLMYCVGAAFPEMSILRLGSVDEFTLMETKLRPTMEQYTKDRVSWKDPLKEQPSLWRMAYTDWCEEHNWSWNANGVALAGPNGSSES